MGHRRHVVLRVPDPGPHRLSGAVVVLGHATPAGASRECLVGQGERGSVDADWASGKRGGAIHARREGFDKVLGVFGGVL